MDIENNRDPFINLDRYCQDCRIVVAVNVTVYVNVTRFPGQNLAVFCAFQINVACPMSCAFVGFQRQTDCGRDTLGFTSVAISVNCFITDALQNSNFFPKCPETGITVIEQILLLFSLIELILNTTREISIYSFSRSKTTYFS